MKRKRCGKGNPCGYTCIERNDRCVLELGKDVSDGVSKAAKTISSRGEPRDKDVSKFVVHVTENSFSIPGAQFSGKDLANAMAQAHQGLTGEAKENLRKTMDFVVRDNQSAIISMPRESYVRNGVKAGGVEALENLSSWVKSPEFKRVMQFSYGSHKHNPLYLANRLNVQLSGLKIKEGELLRKIEVLSQSGRNPKSYQDELRETRKRMGVAKETLKSPNLNTASFFLGREGLEGFTNSNSRQTVIMDLGFDKKRGVDVGSLSMGIRETMGKRARWAELSPDDQLSTSNIHGLGRNQKSINERTLSTYLHEVGHQFHYRSGIEDPPRDSISLSRREGRGLSWYSTQGPREVFAEAFVAFVLNPSALRKYDEPIYNWVSRNFDEALRNAGSQTLVPDF